MDTVKKLRTLSELLIFVLIGLLFGWEYVPLGLVIMWWVHLEISFTSHMVISHEIRKINQPITPQTQAEKARDLDAIIKGLELKKALIELEITSVRPPERKGE